MLAEDQAGPDMQRFTELKNLTKKIETLWTSGQVRRLLGEPVREGSNEYCAGVPLQYRWVYYTYSDGGQHLSFTVYFPPVSEKQEFLSEEINAGIFIPEGFEENLNASEVGARSDGHSTFSLNFNSTFYPKVSASFIFKDGAWWDGPDLIKTLQLKGSYPKVSEAEFLEGLVENIVSKEFENPDRLVDTGNTCKVLAIHLTREDLVKEPIKVQTGTVSSGGRSALTVDIDKTDKMGKMRIAVTYPFNSKRVKGIPKKGSKVRVEHRIDYQNG